MNYTTLGYILASDICQC